MSMIRNYLGSDINVAPTVYGTVDMPGTQTDIGKTYDTVIVGGGFAGLHTAIELAERGQKVILFEGGRFGDGPSARNGGQLWPGFSQSLSQMQQDHGRELANTAWRYVHEGLAKVHKRLAAHPARCDFRPGVAYLGTNPGDDPWSRQEEKVYVEAGFTFARYVSAQTIRETLFNCGMFTGGLLYAGVAQEPQYGHVNPVAYAETLGRIAGTLGVTLVEQAQVSRIGRTGTGRYDVCAGRHQVDAASVVLATGAEMIRPAGVGFDILPRYFVRVQTVIVATEPFSPELARQMVPGDACGCDMLDIGMHYFRMVPACDGTDRVRLTVGGADALMQFRAARVFEAGAIQRHMYTMFPLLDEKGIRAEVVWGGNCDLTPSALPRLDELVPGLYQMSGFCGQGNILTQVLGEAVAEKIVSGRSARFDAMSALTRRDRPYPRLELLAMLKAGCDLYVQPVVDSARKWLTGT